MAEGSRHLSHPKSNVRLHGTCKWFNVKKGWGFLTADDPNCPEVFVHQSCIHKSGFRSLDEGERVEFETANTEKGVEATFVCGLDGAECHGSDRRPLGRGKYRRPRCFNCGEHANHLAADCPLPLQPKRCHYCRSTEHLIGECPLRDQQEAVRGSSETRQERGILPPTPIQ